MGTDIRLFSYHPTSSFWYNNDRIENAVSNFFYCFMCIRCLHNEGAS
jgi:hypothetical protein